MIDCAGDWIRDRRERKTMENVQDEEGPLSLGMQAFKEETGEEEKGVRAWYKRVKKDMKKKSADRKLRKVDFYGQVSSAGIFNMVPKPGKGWAVDYATTPPTLIYPEKDLEEKSAEQIAGVTMHEAGHRDISFIDKFFFKKHSRRFLLNAIEDPRVNNWVMQKVPGSRKCMDELYQDIFPGEGEDGKKDISKTMLHTQFGLGLIHHWYHGEDHPKITDRRVLDALAQTREDVVEAYNTLPGTVRISRYDEDRLLLESPMTGRKLIPIPSVGQKT